MKTLEKASLELMVELRDICESNGFRYYLAPGAASYARICGGFGDKFVIPRFLMPIDDVLKLKSYIENNMDDSRYVECMENNPNYSMFEFSYVNENSTLIYIKRGFDYSHHGVRVIINVLRPCPDNKQLSRKELLLECAGFSRRLSAKHELVNKIHKKAMRLAKNHGYAQKLYKEICDYYCNKSADKVFYKMRTADVVTYPASLFNKTGEITFEGERFCVPEDVEKYLNLSTNGRWKTVDESTGSSFREFIFFDDYSYKDIIRRLHDDGIDLATFFNDREWRNYARNVIKVHNDDKNNLWRIARRSGERIKLYKELSPQLDEIRMLAADKKYDELTDIFERYDKEAHRFLNWDMGLCPSREIMEIECSLLENRGEQENARRLRDLTPEEHYTNPLGEQ